MAGLFGYVDPALGGAQGVTNIIGGIESGDPQQIAGGAYQGLGAYTAANSIMTQQAFEAGYAAALEMGLEGTAATQYANAAAEGAGLPGGGAVGQWLPYVGLGLSVYNLATNPSQQAAWYTALSAFSLIPGAAPFALTIGAIAGSIGYAKSQSAKHAKHYIQWHTPKLEVIGQDEDGWTYLYDTNFEFHTGGWIGEEESPSAQARRRGFILRYNPETNELQKTNMWYQSSFSRHHFHHMTPEQAIAWIAGEDPGLTSQSYKQLKGSDSFIRKQRNACVKEGGRVSEQHVAGGANNYYCVTDHAVSSENKKYPKANWKTIDLTNNWDESGKRDPVITDPSAFQAEIYNNVLLPQGYVDAPSAETGWSTVTMGGQEYFINSDGYLADIETGYLMGAANPETGQVIDFSGPRGKSRVRKSSGEIQSGSISYLGTIDNWDQISSSFDPSIPSKSPTAETLLPGQGVQQPAVPQGSGGLFGISDTAQQLLPPADTQPGQPSGGLFGVTPSTSPQPNQTSFFPPPGGSNITGSQIITPDQPDSGGLGLGGNNSMGLFDTTTTTTSGGEAEKMQAPGPMPAGGDAIWQEYLNTVFGSPGEGEPPYLASALAGQQAAKDQSNAAYVKSIEQAAQPYNQAVDAAKANPINISFGGRPVGNVMMQGGMAAEKERMGVNMLAPAAEYDYTQQNTPYTAYLNYVDYLGKTAMEMQGLAYGIPSTDTTGSYRDTEKKTPSVDETVGNWIDIINAGTNIVDKAYDAGQSWGWWGSTPTP